MRAVAVLAFLELLEQRTSRRVCQMFDMIVGTSTGGIVAVLLGLLRWSVADARALYLKMGAQVFNVEEKGSLMTQGYYYSPTPLEAVFREVCGEKMMCDYPANPDAGTPHVIIVANEIDMLPAQRVFFRNYGKDDASNFSRVPLWIALRATTAAPLYFPCIRWNSKHYIDGGMGSNNPVMTAVREAELLWGFHCLVCVCSVGTGQFPRRKNTFLVGESVGRSLLGGLNSGGMFSKLVSTAVSGASSVSLMQVKRYPLGDMHVLNRWALLGFK